MGKSKKVDWQKIEAKRKVSHKIVVHLITLFWTEIFLAIGIEITE